MQVTLPHPSLLKAQSLLDLYWPAHSADAMASCYGVTHQFYPVLEISLDSIEPFERAAGQVGILDERATRLIEMFTAGVEVPVLVVEVKGDSGATALKRYRLHDGYHRYYLALAVGCDRIRAAVMPA